MEVEKYIIAEDPLLVEWALEGDNTAFEFLVTRYKESIQRLLLARINSKNEQDAQDILQESFIKVYVNLHRYDAKYTFGQWLYTIVRNTMVDFQRKRTDTLSLDDQHANPPEEHSPNPEQSIINRQKRSQIELGIAQLKPAQQELFRMRFIEEYTYEEIAEKLNMPLGSVKTNIYRTRAIMCQFITDHEEM
ncbi:MAG: sigma-70 family RNA polymerase sigma factor [Rikenellaceae bacterium]